MSCYTYSYQEGDQDCVYPNSIQIVAKPLGLLTADANWERGSLRP